MSLYKTRKSYMSLLMFLKRKKVENPGLITSLYFEKFINSQRPTNYHSIKAEDLKIKGIIPSKSAPNFHSWRSSMINKGLLICMAGWEELKEEEANYKACMFKYGENVKKYIEAALSEKSSIFERLDTKVDKEELDLKVDCLQSQIDELKDNLENILLYLFPPDTLDRREIIQKNRKDKERCVQLLKNGTTG